MDAVLDTAPCGFLSFGDDGIVTAVNSTLLEMLGYQRQEVVGKHLEQLLTVGTRIFYQTHWFPLLKLHGRAEEVFLMARTRAGEPLGVLSYAHRRGETGPYDCVLVHVRERAKYEDELLRARRVAEEANTQLEMQALELELQQQQLRERTEEAEQLRVVADRASRAKSDFLAMISHELRTPLNAIGGYLQILELGIPGPITEAQRDILGRLDQSSRHLLRLINEVLDLARIESGRVDYEITTTAASDLLASVMPMIEPQLADRDLRFSFDVPRELLVRADVEKGQQILLNLLGNAVKFTPTGGSVAVTAGRSVESAEYVDITVSDTGIGIPADQLESIFQPFVQVEGGFTRPAEGSGLGLAISRDLARGMGGNVFVESVVGAGSRFTLRLPVAPDS
jgi:signal transduction histidine kinase